MRMYICDGVALVASSTTCNRVAEAFRLYDHLRGLDPYQWDSWFDFNSEVEYCLGRIDLLLGFSEVTAEAIECFGAI